VSGYFTTYNAGIAWSTTPENMCDLSTSTYAKTIADENQRLTEHNTTSFNGDIAKVEIRHYSKRGAVGPCRVRLTPYFDGSSAGTVYQEYLDSSSGKWYAYQDITNSTNAPSPWTWSDVENLDVNILGIKDVGAGEVYTAKVEVRITYDPIITVESGLPAETIRHGALGAASGRSIARDSSGNLHVAYINGTWNGATSHLMHGISTNDGTDWTHTTVNSDHNYIQYTDIAIDTNDNVYIGWRDGDNDVLMVSKYNGSSWDAGSTIKAGNDYLDMAICADSQGNIHAVYAYSTPSSIIYHKHYNGSSWSDEETVVSLTGAGSYQICYGVGALANYAGTPYAIAHHYDSAVEPHYRWAVYKKDGTWTNVCTITGDATWDIYSPSTAIDKDGYLHMVAENGTDSTIVYSKWDLSTGTQCGSWTTLGSDAVYGHQQNPTISIAEVNNDLYVAWIGPNNDYSQEKKLEWSSEDGDTIEVRGEQWAMQRFYVGSIAADVGDIFVSNIKLKLYRTGSPGNVLCSVGSAATDYGVGTIAASAITTNEAGDWYTFTVNADTYGGYVKLKATGGDSDNYVAWLTSTYDAVAGYVRLTTNDGDDWETISTQDACYEIYGMTNLVHTSSYNGDSWSYKAIPASVDVNKFYGYVRFIDAPVPVNPLWNRMVCRPKTGYFGVFTEVTNTEAGNGYVMKGIQHSPTWGDDDPFSGTLSETITLTDTVRPHPSTLRLNETITPLEGLTNTPFYPPPTYGYSVYVEGSGYLKVPNIFKIEYDDPSISVTDVPEFEIETDNITGRHINQYNVGKGCKIYKDGTLVFLGEVMPREFKKSRDGSRMSFGGYHMGYNNLRNRVCDYYRADNNSYAPVVNPWQFGRKITTANALVDGLRPDEIIECLIGTKFIWQEWFDNHDYLRWTTTKAELIVNDGNLQLPKTATTTDAADNYATSGYVESIGLYNGDKNVDVMGNITSVSATLIGTKYSTYNPDVYVCRDADETSPNWHLMTLTYDGDDTWSGTYTFTDGPAYMNQFGFAVSMNSDGAGTTGIDYAKFVCFTSSDTSVDAGTITEYDDPNTTDDTIATDLSGLTRLEAIEKVREITNTSTAITDSNWDTYIDNDLSLHFTSVRGSDIDRTFSFANKNIEVLSQKYDGEIKNALIAMGQGEPPWAVTLVGTEMQDATSIATYGKKVGYFIDKSIPDAPTLYKRAKAYLKYMKDPRENLTISLINEPGVGWDVGDRIKITDDDLGLSGEYYRVLARKTTKVMDSEEKLKIELGTKADTIGKFFDNIKNKFDSMEIASQGTGSPINTLADGLVYDTTNAAEYTFYIPKNAQRVLLSVKTNKFRAYSKAALAGGATTQTAAITDTTLATNYGISIWPVATTLDANSTPEWISAIIPTSPQGTYSGCEVSIGIFNKSGSNDTYTWQLLNTTRDTTIAAVSDYTINDNNWYVWAYNFDNDTGTGGLEGDLLKFNITDGILGTEGTKIRQGWIFILINTQASHAHSVSMPNHTHNIDFGIYEYDYYPAKTCMRIGSISNPIVQKLGYIGTESTPAEVVDLDITDNLRDTNGKLSPGRQTLYFSSQPSASNTDGLGIITVAHRITVLTSDNVDLSPLPT